MAAFAALFVPNADFVNVIGMQWRGRTQIQETHVYLAPHHLSEFHQPRAQPHRPLPEPGHGPGPHQLGNDRR